MKNLIVGILSIPVVLIVLIFQIIRTIFLVILGIFAVSTGQTRESLARDIQKERAELDRVKERAFRPETALDQFEDLTVEMYRNYARQQGIPPTSKTYDHEILEVVKLVGTNFSQAAELRGEHIPGSHLITINVHFLYQYETFGKEFFLEHLKYEVDKYLKEGLRDDYKKDLGLI